MIMNVDIRSMHGGAQHGLRISAFWLLAFGFVLSVASIWFCIASWDLVSGVWLFFFMLILALELTYLQSGFRLYS